jgi:hypothetical protein
MRKKNNGGIHYQGRTGKRKKRMKPTWGQKVREVIFYSKMSSIDLARIEKKERKKEGEDENVWSIYRILQTKDIKVIRQIKTRRQTYLSVWHRL